MKNIKVYGLANDADSLILNEGVQKFVAKLARTFYQDWQRILELRSLRCKEIDSGVLPDFLSSTKRIREDKSWRVGSIPQDLQQRWVEITGPAGDRKMVINGLNSGADTYMADFEDSQSPTRKGLIDGQVNIYDAVRGQISYCSPEGKEYHLNEKGATLIVRPRGWHLEEKHMVVDDRFVPASLFDFGLAFYHNAKYLLEHGSGPYFYLSKTEGHPEARLWNEVFLMAQDELNISRGSIKATVLIETITAAFEMEEILYELRDHCVGLNCGRWDYIFSFIKKFAAHKEFVLPDRAQVTMDKAFLAAYVKLLIQTCHRRGAYAIGGMAAQIPIKNDPEANEAALVKVREDKIREVKAGHDGTWVAHPGLVPLAREIFERGLSGKNQLTVLREGELIRAEDLLEVTPGSITEFGLRKNINIGIQYLESWLRGAGCVPINNLMEDAATAEISRSQVWQWVRHGAVLEDGRVITRDLVRNLIQEEGKKIKSSLERAGQSIDCFSLAHKLFEDIVASENFVDFITIPGYERLIEEETGGRR